MGEKKLMRGTEAIAEAAIRAGCTHFFGYPITPTNELLEYMAVNLPEKGGVFLEAENEVAAINMVYGAAAAGARVMTASSGPGISLMAEGFSFLAAAELPCVIVDVERGGPGLGNISPSQSDYSFVVKGAGHGDFKLIVLAPYSIQEAADLTMDSFLIADKYRNPVLILTDGILGEMMEKVIFRNANVDSLSQKDWIATGANNRSRNRIITYYGLPDELEEHNLHLKRKYDDLVSNYTKCERYKADDADYLIIAFGICARICKKTISISREKGIRIGLIRIITLFPFPSKKIRDLARKSKAIIVVEMNLGQMFEDVKLAVNGLVPVYFYGRTGGSIPKPSEVFLGIEKIVNG